MEIFLLFSQKCYNIVVWLGHKSVSDAAWKVFVFGVMLVRIFPHSDWIRRDTKYMGKYGPEWLQIRTLFTQCDGSSNVLEFKKTLRMMIRFKFLSLKLLYIVWIWIIPLTLVDYRINSLWLISPNWCSQFNDIHREKLVLCWI